MTGEGELPLGRENSQTVVGPLVRRRADECRLGQVGPGRDRLHLRARQRVAIEHDRDGVALEWHGREDIHLLEGERVHLKLLLATFDPRSESIKAASIKTVTDNSMCDHNSCCLVPEVVRT